MFAENTPKRRHNGNFRTHSCFQTTAFNTILVILLVLFINHYAIEFFTKLICQITIGYGGNLMWLHHPYIKPTDNLSANATMKIPKIIHQTYQSIDNIPKRWMRGKSQWIKYHKNWTYFFWNDSDIDAFMRTHFEWFIPVYDSYPNDIQRVDAFRYFVLFHFGGIYSDLDVAPQQNIEFILSSANPIDVMLVETPNVGLTNSLLASDKQSDFLQFVIDHLADYHSNQTFVGRFISKLPNHCQILFSTGSTALWILYSRYFAEGGSDHIGILHQSDYGRSSLCFQNKKKLRNALYSISLENGDVDVLIPDNCDGYFEHSKGNSWHSRTSWHINFFLHCHPIATLLFCCLIVWILYNGIKLKFKRGLVLLWLHRNLRSIGGCILLIIVLFWYKFILFYPRTDCE